MWEPITATFNRAEVGIPKAPTGKTMKLSEDAKMRADALLSKSTYEIAVWGEDDQRRIRTLRTQSNPQFNLMAQHYEERIRRAFKALINAYVEGYRMDESLIDD